MPRLRKRNGKWHYDITVAGYRERKSTGTSNKALAEDIAAKREWEIRRAAVHGPEAVLKFDAAVDLYLDAGKDPRFIMPLFERWKDTLLKDITAGAITQAAIDLYPRASAATRNRQVITPARAIINHAAELGYCSHIRVRRFKEAKTERRAVDGAWMAAFMSVAPERLSALALFMFQTGARIGEATALTWDRTDLQAGTAYFPQTKTGEPRTVYLTTELVAMLANLTDRHPRKPFGYAHRGSVYSPWRKACEDAGIAYVPPHQAGRHSFATEMIIRNGLSIAETADLGGWKSHRLLSETYAHPENRRATIEKVFGKRNKS